ncbi:ABC transporter ATP-binding protein [Bhargavaea beijingensis]|uniref:ABC-type nitrate/sulfonate/bicarbonate transport system, ATPase component n=1 Tax=Bhargavaea beijingensis TaxID=426756 RepID=A0A1G7A7U8_9BACL|nr:ABC transporter ATP-binding protein [Bhargavaea beijingensis]MCW1927323.1 ABC transporter ATP-binding protein [Bhargavaea beijingensis]SDE10860.1 ABC-type nitrate/sulfonate/bicarbonate transport system, ATPase component [Bhargavaea beijingensis]
MAELAVHDLHKKLGQTDVLGGLSFRVGDGEFVSILGPSGSGKSTLFQLIGGLLEPDGGEIRLGEQPIRGRRGMISYMPQRPSLLPWRTVLDNVRLGAEIAGAPDPPDAIDMLDKAGLGGYADAYPHQLSGGMQQRTAFIRSLLSPQDFICLDEPFSALDEFTRAEMQQWLLSLWEENPRSILFVTHNIEEAIYLSDRILILTDKPAQLLSEYHVPFRRPRTPDLILSEEFLDIRRQIARQLTAPHR